MLYVITQGKVYKRDQQETLLIAWQFEFVGISLNFVLATRKIACHTFVKRLVYLFPIRGWPRIAVCRF